MAWIESTSPPQSVHVVRIHRHAPSLTWTTTLASNSVLSLQPLSRQLSLPLPPARTPVAAVNGDFFVIARNHPYRGDPRGLQILDHEWVSWPHAQPFVFFDDRHQIQMGRVSARLTVNWTNDLQTASASATGTGTGTGLWTVSGLNQERAQNQAILYTPRHGLRTGCTNATELRLIPSDRQPPPIFKEGGPWSFRVDSISTNSNAELDSRSWILSVPHEWMTPALRRAYASQTSSESPPTVGSELWITCQSEPSLADIPTAISGGPVLLENGVLVVSEGTNAPVHPRTAIGWNDNWIWLVVVDGRQPNQAVGMTLTQLAEIFIRAGCDHAINLDGGGSSTLWARGRVRNSPSDTFERAIANGLVLLEAAAPAELSVQAPPPP